jgi:hypothetical protein
MREREREREREGEQNNAEPKENKVQSHYTECVNKQTNKQINK